MNWAGAAFLFVVTELIVASLMALELGFYEPPPFEQYFATALIPVIGYAVWLPLWNLRRRPERPLQHVMAMDWMPLARLAGAMALVWLQFVVLTWMKAMIPLATTMWADIPLADLEAAILGQDAWRLLPLPNSLIETIYFTWPLVVCGAFVTEFLGRRLNRDQSLLAFFLTIGLLGAFGQYLLPSGGPIFWERLGYGNRFAEMEILDRTMIAGSKLWHAYQGHAVSFASGISAFPSIHVATTAWIAISFRHWLSYAYLAVIFFGSIILGWHYAIDGVAGIAGALICYAFSKAILRLPVPQFGLSRDRVT